MIPSKQRITGKEVQLLLRRGKKIYGKTFVLCALPQRYGCDFHQFAVQIPIKADKRATMRNLLKRTSMSLFVDYLDRYSGPKQKFFLFVNKKYLGDWAQILATTKKTAIVEIRKKRCELDFNYFMKHLSSGNS